jgi:hypothetical protein
MDRLIYIKGTTIACKDEATYLHLQRIILSTYFKTIKLKSNDDNSEFPVIRYPTNKFRSSRFPD